MGICNTLLSALCTAPSPILPSALRLSGCPPARGWWHSNPQPETPPVLDRPEWRVPALAARVRRAITDVTPPSSRLVRPARTGAGALTVNPIVATPDPRPKAAARSNIDPAVRSWRSGDRGPGVVALMAFSEALRW